MPTYPSGHGIDLNTEVWEFGLATFTIMEGKTAGEWIVADNGIPADSKR